MGRVDLALRKGAECIVNYVESDSRKSSCLSS